MNCGLLNFVLNDGFFMSRQADNSCEKVMCIYAPRFERMSRFALTQPGKLTENATTEIIVIKLKHLRTDRPLALKKFIVITPFKIVIKMPTRRKLQGYFNALLINWQP